VTAFAFHAKAGAGRRIRTDDLLITNQLLYQLSYAGDKRREISADLRLKQAGRMIDMESLNLLACAE
jgi:hypothetical protein